MPKKRLLVEGKDWSVDSVEGGKELFRMMCIDASKKMADGTMRLGVSFVQFVSIRAVKTVTVILKGMLFMYGQGRSNENGKDFLSQKDKWTS